MTKKFAEYLNQRTVSSVFDTYSLPDNAISIKIRPLVTDTNDEYIETYQGLDYQMIREYLSRNHAEFTTEEVRGGGLIPSELTLITSTSGERIYYTSHETGPEFLYVLDVASKAMEFLSALGGIILFIIEAGAFRNKQSNNNANQFNTKKIEAVRIEKISNGGVLEVTKTISFDGNENIDIEAIKELFK